MKTKLICLAFVISLAFPIIAAEETVPESAIKYRRMLTKAVNYAWGIYGNDALAAAQVHKESTWNPFAESPYAKGLTQFTKPTITDMRRWYPDTLSDFDPFNPQQALMAQSLYNNRLWNTLKKKGVTDPCELIGFTLSAYNGGLGWLTGFKGELGDRRLAEINGKNPNLWWNNVELFSNRIEKSIKENRNYPKRIVFELMPLYIKEGYGGETLCQDQQNSIMPD